MSVLARLFRRGMSCSQVAAVLQQYLDDELDASQVPRVLEHLEACRGCGLEASIYRRIKQSLIAHQQAPDEASMARIRALADELATTGLPSNE